jgi:hypothetical protein
MYSPTLLFRTKVRKILIKRLNTLFLTNIKVRKIYKIYRYFNKKLIKSDPFQIKNENFNLFDRNIDWN